MDIPGTTFAIRLHLGLIAMYLGSGEKIGVVEINYVIAGTPAESGYTGLRVYPRLAGLSDKISKRLLRQLHSVRSGHS